VLDPSTRLCIARGISSSDELIWSASIADWKAAAIAPGKHPTIFLIGTVPSTSLDRRPAFRNSNARPCKNRKR
jgi:hypothetical protein